MDDILVHDASENSHHLEHLRIIFQKIREAGSKPHFSKSVFFKRHLQHLEHSMSGEGIYSLK